jgi:endonuclease I
MFTLRTKTAIWTAVFILMVTLLPALTLINENIQNWTAYTSYGSYTQQIPAGTVAMTSCIVSPGAAATGTCTAGRIQMQAATGIVELPQLTSVGSVELHLAAGSTGRSVKLQRLVDTTWEDITIFNGIATTGATFSWEVNLGEPTTLRLAVPSHALYVHDIIVTDYQVVDLPIVTTYAVSNITYNSAVGGGNVENSGAAPVTARGICWSLLPNPTLDDSVTTSGTGIGTFTCTLAELASSTTYHVRAFATNSLGTAYGEDVNFTTSNLGIPTLQTTNLVFYPGSTSIQASWTPGNGSKRIVKINTVNSFTNPPNDVLLIANTVYAGAGEQVVYNGATQVIEGEAINSVTVTGLTPNTTYWFRVYDYNWEGSSYFYNTNTATNNPRGTTTLNTVLTGYYEGITGTGATLKTNLHNLLRTTHLTEFSYDALWTQLQYTDEDSTNTNNIIEIYTGWSVPKSYSGGGTSQWNREHTWSKSHGDFGETAPAGTDLHHLRPCDSTVNSAKGNKDFDDGGAAFIDSSPYTGYSGTTGCYTDTDSWEPRAAEKGDIARIILYMATRYDGTDTSYDLEMQDLTPTSGPFYGRLSTLLQWHVQDPPDSWERRRNNRIHERQGNRNPFIDHPEFVNQIWAPTTLAATLTDSVTFVANWSPSVNAQSYVLDVSTDNDFTTFIPGFHNLNVGSATSRTVTVPASNTTYFYRLRAYFTYGYSMYSNVTSVPLYNTLPLELSSFTVDVSFLGNVLALWTTQSESGLTGFYLFRAAENNLSSAAVVSPLIPATNTSQEQHYDYLDDSIPSSGTYYYWLKAVYLNGGFSYHGPVSVQVTANEDEINIQTRSVISRIYPNPFRSNVSIEMNLPKAEILTVNIYNLKGQFIRTLFKGNKAAGTQSLNWDGQDTNGRQCSPGIYLVRLQSDSGVSNKKLILD